MALIEIDSIDDPRLDPYRSLRDADLAARKGLFMVEGRGTLRTLIDDSPFEPISILVSETAAQALAPLLARFAERAPRVPVFVASRALLESIVGFDLHRGCLAACPRPEPTSGEAMIDALADRADALVVVAEGLTDHDNVGSLFRNAMAFGVCAVLLDPRCADPFYRKSIRTSAGGVLRVPFARFSAWPDGLAALRKAGFEVAALDPGGRALPPAPASGEAPRRLALVVGTEGEGLSSAALAEADRAWRIPMAEGVDSLNVATSAAIALHHFAGARLARSAEAPDEGDPAA